jgi:hypothetical protein
LAGKPNSSALLNTVPRPASSDTTTRDSFPITTLLDHLWTELRN